jgi:hypothetical protein
LHPEERGRRLLLHLPRLANRSIHSGWVSDQRRFGSVTKPTGRMALTVILCAARSSATARVNWSTAAFAVP